MRSILLAMVLCLLAIPAHANCTNPARIAATIIYNADHHVLQYCDGTDWIPMGAAGSGSGSCANPAGAEGKFLYNKDSHVPQFCNGSKWAAMGPVPGLGGAGCSGPSRGEGNILYNSEYNFVEYCDGTNWVMAGFKDLARIPSASPTRPV